MERKSMQCTCRTTQNDEAGRLSTHIPYTHTRTYTHMYIYYVYLPVHDHGLLAFLFTLPASINGTN